jgi:hypothetical protein
MKYVAKLTISIAELSKDKPPDYDSNFDKEERGCKWGGDEMVCKRFVGV